MWARVVQIILGCWLAISPFIFRVSSGETAIWFNDMVSAVLIIASCLLSFWHPCRLAYLITLPLSLWLIGFAYLTSPHPAPPALQNDLLVGLLLLMFAIVPNEAAAPPPAWRDFYSLDCSQTDEVRTRELHVSGAIGQRRKG